MDCFGTYFTPSKPNATRVQPATEWTASVHTLHMSKPNVTRVQSATEWTATEWTASVHTLHMSKPIIMYLVIKVLRNGLLRYILYTCPNLMLLVFKMDCFGTYFTHVQT